MSRPDPPEPEAGLRLEQGRRRAEALARRLGARLIETHISWVLLARDEAWKLKKPLRLPFVDYSSLEQRRRCCETELRLNRRYATSLYLGVVRITGSDDAPEPAGDDLQRSPTEGVIDYAVRMHRFDDDALWSRRLAAGQVGGAEVDALAHWLAGVQAVAPRAQAGEARGRADPRRAVALAALEGAAPWLEAAEHERLRAGLEARAAALAALWAARRAEGAVRECHGDLHLDNLLWLDGRVQAFDGVEFDPALRWIDVVDDLAFPVMDLQAHGRRDLAFRLLDGWLAITGDHAGLPALRFAGVYRALVRTMARGLRGEAAEARACVATALDWLEPGPPTLAITHGLPGSGKSTRALQWVEHEGAVRLRSDVERKRLFGLKAQDDSRASGLELYGADVGRLTYGRLLALAREALGAGYPVVLDAAFLRREERDAARALAREFGCAFRLLDCDAPMDELRRRVAARRGDASEADIPVLERLARVAEPLAADERADIPAEGRADALHDVPRDVPQVPPTPALPRETPPGSPILPG